MLRHMNPTDLVGSTQAARDLDVDKSTLTRWVKEGRIPVAHRASDKPNSAMLFLRSDVDRLRADRARPQQAAS